MSEFPIYKAQVLADYDQKLASQQLSSKLIHVTPGNLKKESARVCEERFLNKDISFLRPIFGQKEDASGYRNAIQNGNANPFRPLVNFLRDRKINTDEDNIELLAWLIDFEPRPYMTWLKDPNRQSNKGTGEIPDQKVKEEVVIELKKKDIEEDDETPTPTSRGAIKPILNRKTKIMLALLLLVISGGGFYLNGQGERGLSNSTVIVDTQKKPTGCMVWKQDHYIPAPCDQRDSNLIVPLDTQRLAHLKKLINTNTIRISDAGRIWYFKSQGHLECFTAGGSYPLDTNRRLLPLTAYMIRKYIHRDESK